ncbi:hypothetical protein UL81_09380 [Corynebacterium camporealensis]|uniref:Uncharacterized protein n=2 Tax=Corynebacterium camporealensis TaxID=161896 RepID=A0A0F6QXX4_9CORY|nr:hypothetical protein UL81_09380 [Corynebacterium camporealensis]
MLISVFFALLSYIAPNFATLAYVIPTGYASLNDTRGFLFSVIGICLVFAAYCVSLFFSTLRTYSRVEF